MAYLEDGRNVALVYHAAQRFVDQALKGDGSLFSPGTPVWTREWLDDLSHRFVDNPDESDQGFMDKWAGQLQGAPPETIQLAAELLYVHLLPVLEITGNRKRALLNQVLSWSADPVALPEDLDAALDTGLSRAGAGFHTGRFYSLWFLIRFAQQWKDLGEAERERALSDPWQFKAIAADPALQVKRSRPQCELLLHLVHPETFEPILAHTVKSRIAQSLGDRIDEEVGEDVDRQLLAIRRSLDEEYGENVNFYSPEVRQLWETGSDDTREDVSFWKIQPGRQAHYWDLWRNEGCISVGWTALGDLSAIDADEWPQHRDAIQRERSKWSKSGLNQAWCFATQVQPGDRVVANHGRNKVLGIGTVTGSYYFVEGEEHGHRIPVRWDDLTPRQIEP